MDFERLLRQGRIPGRLRVGPFLGLSDGGGDELPFPLLLMHIREQRRFRRSLPHSGTSTCDVQHVHRVWEGHPIADIAEGLGKGVRKNYQVGRGYRSKYPKYVRTSYVNGSPSPERRSRRLSSF